MENYRSYKPLDRSMRVTKSSRVALVLPKTPRQIFQEYVITGEVPHFRSGGIDASLDVPVKAFGDVEDANSFIRSISARMDAQEAAASEAAAKAKAEREKEMAEAYAKMHNNSGSIEESMS